MVGKGKIPTNKIEFPFAALLITANKDIAALFC